MMENGSFTLFNDIFDIQQNTRIIFAHFCNKRCMRQNSDGDGPESFICHQPNNVKLSPENTKHCFFESTNKFDQ